MKTMEERFFPVINNYMLPIEKLERVIDSSYFLRKNLSFAFAQGYCHPRGGFYGKLINYPDPEGTLNIFGRKYSNTNKRIVNGALELIPIDGQLDLHYQVEPELMRRGPRAAFAEYHAMFALSDCIGFFDHRHSLQVAMQIHPWIASRVREVAELLKIPVDRLGATGSLAYGKIEPEHEHEDLDLTIYGSLEEHRRIFSIIREWLKDPAHRVIEFGKLWPMRFFYRETLVCPFFIYERPEEVPLAECDMEVVQEDVDFSGCVADDRHSIFLPIVLRLEEVKLSGEKASGMPLIIYDSSVRGEFSNGNSLAGRARRVRAKMRDGECEALLVTNGSAVSVQ
ncbi:MAG: hypothetical protein NTZ78_08565 [Candidatus Aureabacteria bacterium]|nr:hypothetical protein [Candidatus Auribacterota bacterium]